MTKSESELQCKTAARNPSGSSQIGDWLLRFGDSTAIATGRSEARWEPLACAQTWNVAVQLPAVEWRGYPILRFSRGVWQAWLLGELYGVTGPDEVLGPFFKHEIPGDATVLNGHFLLWAWNSATDQWHVWTDRFATLHAYYGDNGKQRALGTFFPAVASEASQRTLDWLGLSGFVSFGFFPSDRTHFDDVRILRPAHHYTFDDSGRLIVRQRYWQWRHQPALERSYAETVAEFGDLFQRVMAEHLQQGRTAIPVSGGLDSRSTVAAVAKPDERLWAYSYGYADRSIETRIAGEVAAARGLRFDRFTIGPYLFDSLARVLAWTEGFQDVTQCRQAAVVDTISAEADHLIAALWGDVWFDDMGFAGRHALGHGDQVVVDHTLRRIQKTGRAWLLDHIIAPKLAGGDSTDLQRAMVADELSRLDQIADPDFRIKAYKTEQWSFRWSLPPVRVFQSAAWPRPIFYDTRLTDFFCSVPTEFVKRRQLQIDYLKEFAPDLARIKWQVYEANLYQYDGARKRQLPKRAFRKIWRLATGRRPAERNWEVQFLGPAGRAGLERWLLRSGLRLHEFVPPHCVKELLERLYAAPHAAAKPGYTVSMLLTFSAWLEKYG